MKGKTNKKVKNRQDSQESNVSTQTSSSIREFELFQQFCSPDTIPCKDSPLRAWTPGEFQQKLLEEAPPLNVVSMERFSPVHAAMDRVIPDHSIHSSAQPNDSIQQATHDRQKTKVISCTILLLDESELTVEVDKNSTGKELHEKIFRSLDLAETDYFSCFTWHPNGSKTWISYNKKLTKQVESKKYRFEFGVKFYPPDPLSLQETLTRYLLCLQIQKDIFAKRLPCSFYTLALLGSYVVQSELGDYSPEIHGSDATYVHNFSFYPNQSQELVGKISELHKSHSGLSSPSADDLFLLNASKLALYGVHRQEAKDAQNNAVEIGVNSGGLVVHQDSLRLHRFVWPGMLRISYRGTKFIIDVRPNIKSQKSKTSFKYKMADFSVVRGFWQVVVEHHSFFRMKEMVPEKKGLSLLNLGQTQFKFERRTHFQTLQASSMISRPPPNFARMKYSISQSKSFHSSADQILNSKSHYTPSLFSQHEMFSEPSLSSLSPVLCQHGAAGPTMVCPLKPCDEAPVKYQVMDFPSICK